MQSQKVRWGILGAAGIAHKNWKGLRLSGNSTITGVASRNPEHSRKFIEECQAEVPFEQPPKAFASYTDLLASDQIDAVYIPLPTGPRTEWVIRAAEAGKHVVCEKPCGGTVADLQRMLAACEANRVQFMDGVMFMHSARLNTLRSVLDDGKTVGDMRRITTAFTFAQAPEFFTDNIRVHSVLEPLGCLGDLGWYCIRFILWLMRWQMPTQVTGHLLDQHGRPDSPAPVSTGFQGHLLFPGNVSADYYCSFVTETEQWARISGTRGILEISDYVLPWNGPEIHFQTHHTAVEANGCNFQLEDVIQQHTTQEHSHGNPNAQESLLFRNFSAQVLSGTLNPDWPDQALKTQIVTNACLDSAQQSGQAVRLA